MVFPRKKGDHILKRFKEGLCHHDATLEMLLRFYDFTSLLTIIKFHSLASILDNSFDMPPYLSYLPCPFDCSYHLSNPELLRLYIRNEFECTN